MKIVNGILEVESTKVLLDLKNALRTLSIHPLQAVEIEGKKFELGNFDPKDLKQYEEGYKEINKYIEENNIDYIEVDIETYDIFSFLVFSSYETKKEAMKFYKKLVSKNIEGSIEERNKKTVDELSCSIVDFINEEAFERIRSNMFVLGFDFANEEEVEYLSQLMDETGKSNLMQDGAYTTFCDIKNYYRRFYKGATTYPEFNIEFLKNA